MDDCGQAQLGLWEYVGRSRLPGAERVYCRSLRVGPAAGKSVVSLRGRRGGPRLKVMGVQGCSS